jgi:hypothetical protein
MSIKTELQKRVTDFATAQSIPVALPNVPFTKPSISTGKFLEVIFLGSVTINPDIGAVSERETGVMQINVCVPLGQGDGIGDSLAANIKNLFPVVPKTGTVSIERPANIAQSITREDGWRVIPISISYRQER